MHVSTLYCVCIHAGPYQRAPSGVNLTNVRPDELTFAWTQIDPNCPTVQYNITSDCGSCSTGSGTSATCSNLQLSATERNCTFSIKSMICGFTGPSSNAVTVTLRGTCTCTCMCILLLIILFVVPDAPQVSFIPVYSSASQELTNLVVQINQMMVSICIIYYLHV